MPLTFADLIRLRTRDELRDALLGELATRGFPVTSWGLGGVARTLVEGVAQGTADLWLGVAAIARGMLLDYAEGDWLTELARSHYDVPRIEATRAEGYIRLTAVPGAGPYNLAAASVVVSDGTRLYRSTNAATLVLPAGGFVDVPVRADGAGSAYNVPTVTGLVVPALAGVDATSPAYGGGATWRTRDGRDAETDADLRTRCRSRWSTLGRGATADAYVYLATTAPAAAGVTRARVVVGPGDGTLTVYLATTSGVASLLEAAAVQTHLNGQHPVTDVPTATPATAIPVTVTLTVRTPDTSSTNAARVGDALSALQRSLGLGARVDVGALYHAAYHATGVRDVTLSSPTADVVVADNEVAVLSWTVTLVAP